MASDQIPRDRRHSAAKAGVECPHRMYACTLTKTDVQQQQQQQLSEQCPVTDFHLFDICAM